MRTLVVGRSYFTGNSFHIFVLFFMLLIALAACGNGSTPHYDVDPRAPIQNLGIAKPTRAMPGIFIGSPVENLVFPQRLFQVLCSPLARSLTQMVNA